MFLFGACHIRLNLTVLKKDKYLAGKRLEKVTSKIYVDYERD
jgi:hypothetical protein